MMKNIYSCTPIRKLFYLTVLILLLSGTVNAQVAPVALDDTLTTNEDVALNDSVSLNDSDADGPFANYTLVTSTANGILLLNGDGTFTYTPDLNFNGTDSFVYSLCDGGTPDLCDSATVVINVTAVNDMPSISQTGGSLPEEDSVTFCPFIADVDTGQVLTVSICNGPANGTAVADTNCITYIPNSNFNGADSMCVMVCDNGTPVLCDTVMLPIMITAVNDEPLSKNDGYVTNEDIQINGDVTTNDSDVDGPLVNVTLVTATVNGTLVLNTDGTFTYTPGANYNGVDTFVYSYCDGGTPELCDTSFVAILVIPVNDTPTIIQPGGSLPEDASGVFCPAIADVDTGQVLTISLCNPPLNGTATIDTNCIAYTPNTNFNGTDSICVIVCDNGLPVLCDTVIVVATITPVNDAPSISQAPVSVIENSTVTFCPALSDIDAGDILGLSFCSNAVNGTASVDTNCVTYTPNPGFSGTDSICLVVCDNGTPALCDTTVVIINIAAANIPPVATNDNVTVSEEGTLNSTTVLVNDTDADGNINAATVTLAGSTANGTVTLNSDGTFTYTPAANYNGTDTFTYSVCDTGAPSLCDTAIVVITVTPVNDAPLITQTSVTVDQNDTVTFCPSLTDIDGGDVVALNFCSGPFNGIATIDTNCTTYIPTAGFSGTDSICLVVCDNGTPALCDTTVVFITVTPVNAPPVANNDNVAVNEDGTVNATVLTNDTDPDGNINPNSVTLVGSAANGTVTLNNDGTYSYTPTANYNGADTFTYSVCDLGTPSLCDTAAVIITIVAINDAPVITATSITVAEDSFITVCTPFADADGGDTHTTALCSSPPNGAASATINGGALCITYSPNANFNGNDSVCVIVCDNGTPAACDTINVQVTVTPVNDKPVAADDNITTIEETPGNGDVSTNDADVDGPGATYTIAGNPSNGTLVLGTNGTYIYTPNANFAGCDTALITICDGGTPNLCDTSLLVVCVTPVNDAPVSGDDNNSTTANTPLAGDVSSNDTDADGSGATYTVVGNPTNGTLVLSTNGNYTYTPNTGFAGCDTAVIALCDGGTPNLCDTSLLVICVTAANNPPVAQNDNLTSPEDATLLINVLANDVDPEGNLGNPTILDGPGHGTVTVNNDGTITYQPEPNFNGTDSFIYIVCDGGTPQLCDTATVVLTITPVDDTPEVDIQPLVTDEDVSGYTCFDYILDNNADSVAVNIVCSPSNGTVDSVYAASGQICVVYTPDQEFNGEDSVCVQLCDLAGGGCVTVTVPITVNAIEDACLWLKGISPNGDGQNDAFWINCNDDFANATIRIFNRWGDEVYRSEGHYKNDWYGRNQTGKDLPDGTYFYIYDYGDGVHKAHAGFITVNR